ncbi:MAG TPA: PLP-dependent aminotransferase family protein [Pyrinomonadaceae bacterium]|nr:PLP-dependent aminotransferase family protein [Pyrinomonadaceae bacterium]
MNEMLLKEISLATWTPGIRRSELQEMLVIASRPGILSFALGLPAAELFPVAEFAEAITGVLANDAQALQYGPPFGPLKSHIVSLMAQRNVICREEEIFLTSGAQQGLNLLTRLLLDPGGQVLIEELAYTGLQQVIEPYHPEILTVSTNPKTGMDIEAVAAFLAAGARPAFIYTVSEGHNPMAVSLSASKRAALVKLARLYNVPVIEDDPYGFLCYEDEKVPPMKALSEQYVLYVGSFSKILAPGVRVGWIVAPENLMEKLAVLKEASDINTSTLSQRSVSAYLDGGYLPAHLKMLLLEYRARRDAMLGALRDHFPLGSKYVKPTGGVFIWVQLPETIETSRLLKVALEREQVAFIPGAAFAIGEVPPANHCMRLNFSNCSASLIEKGIARLGRVIKEMP